MGPMDTHQTSRPRKGSHLVASSSPDKRRHWLGMRKLQPRCATSAPPRVPAWSSSSSCWRWCSLPVSPSACGRSSAGDVGGEQRDCCRRSPPEPEFQIHGPDLQAPGYTYRTPWRGLSPGLHSRSNPLADALTVRGARFSVFPARDRGGVATVPDLGRLAPANEAGSRDRRDYRAAGGGRWLIETHATIVCAERSRYAMSNDLLSVAAVQLNAGDDKTTNVEAALRDIDRAAATGARLVALPETWTYMGPDDGVAAAAEPIPGPLTEFLAERARRHGIYLHAGSFYESVPGEPRAFNSTVVFDPAGEIIARYRKIHL